MSDQNHENGFRDDNTERALKKRITELKNRKQALQKECDALKEELCRNELLQKNVRDQVISTYILSAWQYYQTQSYYRDYESRYRDLEESYKEEDLALKQNIERLKKQIQGNDPV